MGLFNVGLDAGCVLACLVLAAYAGLGPARSDPSARAFAALCAVNAVMALADTTNWLCEGVEPAFNIPALAIGTFVYYLCAAPALVLFTFYAERLLCRGGAPVPPAFRRCAVALAAVYVLGCAATLVAGDGFWRIGAGNVYERGSLFAVSQAVPFSLYALNGAMVVRYRGRLRRRELVGFASYLVLPLAAEALQVLFYGVALLNAAVMVSLLLMFASIQAAQEAALRLREKELAEARLDVALSQIQPHFLYNTLAAVRALCSVDPERAARTVGEFAEYLRENMASLGAKAPIPFERELRHTQTYLDLELLRFGERLHVEYDLGPRAFDLPPLSLQPLVENAVRHGVTRRERGGTVSVRTEELPDAFAVVVRDDGVGFDAAAPCDDDRAHLGIANVRERLRWMCGGELEVASEPGVGTCATILVPKGARP